MFKMTMAGVLALAAGMAWTKDIDARAYGAKGDGKTMDTVALQKVIDECSATGGGEVRFTAGTFLTGTLFLRDGVTLRLDASATLLGSASDRDYPTDLKLKRVDETKCHRGRGSALIIADECRNIGIVGKGTIDCNGAAFVELSKSKGYGYQNEGQGEKNAGPLGDDWVNWKYRRKPGVKSPPRMVLLAGCQDVLVEDVTMVHPAAGWAYWVMDCDRVVFDRIKVLADPEFPNNDGIHINASRDVTVSNCRLVTGDDALIVRCNCKPLRSAENKVCERINVVNCQLSSFANCIRIGWLNDGVIRNCTFANLTMTDSAAGIGFDLPPLEPGMDDFGREASVIENLVFSNIAMDRIYSAPVRFDITDKEFTKVDRVRRITFSDMRCRTTRFPSFKSRKGVDIEDVVFRNCAFVKVPASAFPGKWQQKGAAYWYNDGDETFYGFKGLRFDGCTFDCE